MINDPSAEEKLLHLIKRKRKPKAEQGSEAIRPQEDKELQPDGTLRETAPAGWFAGPDSVINFKTVRSINTLFFVVLIFVILYFFADIFFIPPKEIAQSGIVPERAEVIIDEAEVKPYSFYSEEFSKKEIFRPVARAAEKRSAPEIPLEELLGSLSLLGIVSGENPQAIIEEKSSKKSFFIREGQTISGVYLKSIEDGSVTVVYKGEEFNLTL